MHEPKQRFLVIRLSSMGDIVHALPAVTALGQTFPQAEICWAIEARYANLLEGNPFVHRVIQLDTLGWRAKLASAETIEQVVRSFIALRELTFETVIDFQGLVKSALIARLARSQNRLGLAENWLREPVAGVFYTERVAARGRQHVIEENLALVERLGASPLGFAHWQFPLPHNAADDRYVEERLASLSVEDFMVINPGGGWITKRWAPANYTELIKLVGQLEPGLSWKILLTGSREEEGLIQEILARAGSTRASYFPSTLLQFIALARRAKLFVGGDTGPLHLAAAVGAPIVAIYGPTDSARNGPFLPADITLSNSSPIDHTRRNPNAAYLEGIAVDSVLAAIRQRVARGHG